MNDLTSWLSAIGSVGAVLVALVAAFHASRSARASKISAMAAAETAQLDRARRHDELRPKFNIEAVRLHHRGQEVSGFWVTLEGPLDLEKIVVRFDGPAPEEPGHVEKIEVGSANIVLKPNQEMPRSKAFPLRVNDRFRLLVDFYDPTKPATDGTPVRLRIYSERGDEHWERAYTVYTPRLPRVGQMKGVSRPR